MESKETQTRDYLDFGDFILQAFTHDNGAVFIGKRKIDPIRALQNSRNRVYEVRVTYATEENEKHNVVGLMDGKTIFELQCDYGKCLVRRIAVGTLYSYFRNTRTRNGHKSKKGKANDNGNS
jgi:hypothetical protein